MSFNPTNLADPNPTRTHSVYSKFPNSRPQFTPYTPTHTRLIDCFTWTTKAVGKNWHVCVAPPDIMRLLYMQLYVS